MYFKDRAEAGRKLAAELGNYRTKNTTVIALSESSIVVAAQIAQELHAALFLYMIKDIFLPGETQAFAAISSTGAFRYNDALSSGQVTEISQEFRNFIEQERFSKMHDIHVLLGSDGEINKNLLRHHNIILVADALPDGFSLTMVYEYLKTVATKRIVVATPVAGVGAIDRMHVVADELHVGGVTDNFLSIDHYYDDNEKPTFDEVIDIIKNISLTWTGRAEAESARTHHLSKKTKSQVLSRHHGHARSKPHNPRRHPEHTATTEEAVKPQPVESRKVVIEEVMPEPAPESEVPTNDLIVDVAVDIGHSED